ncbi:MAG: OsmC family protein [Bacteroidia bacterium]|nr:OsmC family protein [Bacteroidia bacterium]
MTSLVEYQGGLRTMATHMKSGQQIITDAPTDNQGKGEAFSPTDLLATSLACCALTIMGIKARANGFPEPTGVKMEVSKVMADAPRRVKEIRLKIIIPENLHYSEKEKKILENVVKQCPVAQSIHPDIQVTYEFHP